MPTITIYLKDKIAEEVFKRAQGKSVSKTISEVLENYWKIKK